MISLARRVSRPCRAGIGRLPCPFQSGDPAYPDQSATLLIEATDLERGRALTLSGPGIQDRAALHVDGLEEGFWREWRLNHQRFPLGVDLFLTQGRRICGLPRSTRVEN